MASHTPPLAEITPLDLAQLEQAARLLLQAKHRGEAGLKSYIDVERESEALSLLLAVLQRNGVDL